MSNQAMTQLLSERLGDGAVPAEMLAAMQQGDDPMLALMSAFMNQRPVEMAVRGETERLKNRLKRARRQVALLQKELEAAHELLIYVSELFGMCSRCWGQDGQCHACRGRGGPGTFMPQQDGLLALVAPALDRLELDIVRRETASRRPAVLSRPAGDAVNTPVRQRRPSQGDDAPAASTQLQGDQPWTLNPKV